MQKHSENFNSNLIETENSETDMGKTAILIFILAFLVMMAFSSCSRETYCPKNNVEYFYKQQGAKMPPALKQNLKPRRKYK